MRFCDGSLVLGCDRSPADDVVGTWMADVQSAGVSFTFTFNKDGSFSGEMSVQLMMVMHQNIKCTYRREGQTLAL
jgi:purine nucleoside phosphorylase